MNGQGLNSSFHLVQNQKWKKRKGSKSTPCKSITIHNENEAGGGLIKKAMNKKFACCRSLLLLKLNHPLVHISIWLKIAVNEKSVNNQTGSLTDQYCQHKAVNLLQCCNGWLVISRWLVSWWMAGPPRPQRSLVYEWKQKRRKRMWELGEVLGECSETHTPSWPPNTSDQLNMSQEQAS